MVKWWALVNTVLSLWFLWEAGKFLDYLSNYQLYSKKQVLVILLLTLLLVSAFTLQFNAITFSELLQKRKITYLYRKNT